jgi:hypothetical protein
MKAFFRKLISREKLTGLAFASSVGNLISFAVGLMITTLFTHQTYERRALKNLFGILPRKKVVTHVLPEWLEWTLGILIGFIVMEFIKHLISERIHLQIWRKITGARGGEDKKDLNT